MSARFEELDWRATPIGAISLRRRRDPRSGEEAVVAFGNPLQRRAAHNTVYLAKTALM